jgi:hypothetical protein
MADFHFPAELPIQCVRDLVSAVRAGDYASPETIDHALYAAGCVNALRGGMPTPFGFTATVNGEQMESINDQKLCDALEAEMTDDTTGVGATDPASLPPVVTTLLLELAFRVLRRFLDR